MSFSWRTEWCLCCGCVGLWHDDLGQKIKNHIARDYYTATVSASGAGGYVHTCFWTQAECHFFFCLLCFFLHIFLGQEFFHAVSLWITERTTILRQDQWISVFVSCTSAVSDQVQSLVDC